jgi:hypothetical protein
MMSEGHAWAAMSQGHAWATMSEGHAIEKYVMVQLDADRQWLMSKSRRLDDERTEARFTNIRLRPWLFGGEALLTTLAAPGSAPKMRRQDAGALRCTAAARRAVRALPRRHHPAIWLKTSDLQNILASAGRCAIRWQLKKISGFSIID